MGCVAVPPFAATTPKTAGAPGLVTPPVAWSVATRLLVAPAPLFFRPKVTVTASPGSMAPLALVLAVSDAPLAAMIATPDKQALTFVVAPSVMLKLFVVGAKPALLTV